MTSAARSEGQSQNGGSEALAGMPMRIARDLLHVAALHDGVDEMRGADHDRVDLHRGGRVGAQRLERIQDAGCHVGGGRALDGMDDLLVDDQHGVRVGAADIDANTFHGILSSSLSGREQGTVVEVVAEGARADEFEARGLVSTAGAGSATTVTRWP